MDIGKSIEPILEKIEKLPKAARIGICVGIIILIAAPFVYFAYLPKFDTIKKLNGELKEAKDTLAKVTKKANKLSSVKKELEEVKAEFNVVKKALPESEEIPDLLTAISRAGRDAGLEFLLFEPEKKKKKKKKRKGEKEEVSYYEDIPISIKVLGTYHNAVFFFDKVAKLHRIVNIKDINIASGGKGMKKDSPDRNDLVVSCTAVTYKFKETSPKKKE